MIDVEELAREHFFCPGPFNEDQFARDYARFLIVRKQCTRYLNTGQINHLLALNNCIVLLNGFGKQVVNDIFKNTCPGAAYTIVATLLVYLNVFKDDGVDVDVKLLELLSTTRKSNQYRIN